MFVCVRFSTAAGADARSFSAIGIRTQQTFIVSYLQVQTQIAIGQVNLSQVVWIAWHENRAKWSRLERYKPAFSYVMKQNDGEWTKKSKEKMK